MHSELDTKNKTAQAVKIKKIEEHFTEILGLLGLDLSNESIKGTPRRIAKMYVNELFKGLDKDNMPNISLFANHLGYKEMLIEKNIKLHSICEHHFLPIVGEAHVAYFPKKSVIGLSKINRIVAYLSARPQLQENLTVQIAEELMKYVETDDIAVLIKAQHFCVTMRGPKDIHSETVTSHYSGVFKKENTRLEFLRSIQNNAPATHAYRNFLLSDSNSASL